MSATAPKKDEGAPDSSSGQKAPESQKDDRHVPLGEFIELRQKLGQALEKISALEGKTATPETKQEPQKPANPPPSDSDWIKQKLLDVEQKERVRDLMHEHQLTDQKQGKALFELMQKNADLTSAEAFGLLQARSPELFKDLASGGFDKSIHGSLRPSSPGSQPEPKKSDHKQRIEHMQKLMKAGHKDAAGELAQDMLGAAAAKAIGWDYKPLQIPTQ